VTRHKILTEQELEALMTGKAVRWENPPLDADEVSIEPPASVRDSCHVSWSLHHAIVKRLEAETGRMKDAASVAFDAADKYRARVEELEAELARLRLNIGHNA